MTSKVTKVPTTGVPGDGVSTVTVAVKVWVSPTSLVTPSGDKVMSLITVTPLARMYGVPTDPSGAVNTDPMFLAMANTSKVMGQLSKASCTEQLQLDRFESATLAAVNAGCVATMCALLKQPTPVAVKSPLLPKASSSIGSGVPDAVAW